MRVIIFLGVLCVAGWIAYIFSWLLALKNNQETTEEEEEDDD